MSPPINVPASSRCTPLRSCTDDWLETLSPLPVNVALSGVTPTQFVTSANAQAVTATASVTFASGGVNEGTVTFTLLNGTTPVGQSVQVLVVNGMAQLTSSNPLIVPANTPAGSYTLQAVYSDAAGQFAASQPATAQLTITSPSTPTPTPTPPSTPPPTPIPPPNIPAQIQQLVQDVGFMEQSLMSGNLPVFMQTVQDFESLVVTVELEIFQILLNNAAGL